MFKFYSKWSRSLEEIPLKINNSSIPELELEKQSIVSISPYTYQITPFFPKTSPHNLEILTHDVQHQI